MINISIQPTGPLFDGRLHRGMPHVLDLAKQEIATLGANHLRGDLGRPPFKNPTGWYKSHITPKLMGSIWAIWDSGVIYGPWLAGTSSRNARSRFKGYAHWRRAIVYVNKISKPTGQKIVAQYLKRMGL